ncbi:MAG: hypothetical protein CXT67_07875 [Methanobacteriota archaeon]|nr:MAG: hypothetical protein CXT67_07875 [Euryarchaeota archaeon]
MRFCVGRKRLMLFVPRLRRVNGPLKGSWFGVHNLHHYHNNFMGPNSSKFNDLQKQSSDATLMGKRCGRGGAGVAKPGQRRRT